MTFEEEFTAFVKLFGGEKIPETGTNPIADFFFCQREFIGELKVLSADRTQTTNERVQNLVREWISADPERAKEFVKRSPGAIELRQMPTEIQDKWLEILRDMLEQYVKAANKQIGSTKVQYGLRNARGLLLIFNEADQYHTHPDSFRRVIATLVRKRKQDGTLRYPNINGMTFFSYESVKSHREQMSFWANAQFPHSPDDDYSGMVWMQAQLQKAWYAYISIRDGRPVRNNRDVPNE